MNEKRATILVILAIVVTMISLAWVERNQSDYAKDKDWWAISFANPLPSSQEADFLIENFGPEAQFAFTLASGGSIVREEVISLGTGKKLLITVQEEKINKVTVKKGTETRTLYK